MCYKEGTITVHTSLISSLDLVHKDPIWVISGFNEESNLEILEITDKLHI